MAHTIEWKDGLRVIRVMTDRKQIVLWLDWQGRRTEMRLGPRLGKVIRRSKTPA